MDPAVAAFVDTAGLYAVLDRSDVFHRRAAAYWREVVEQRSLLVTHNYVLVETVALTQRRLGAAAVRALQDDLLPLIEVEWVDGDRHSRAMTALLASGRPDISLVDWMSFEAMRRRGLQQVFTFDEHFREQGFAPVPEGHRTA